MPLLAEIAVGAVAGSADDHGREIAERRLELLAHEPCKLACKLRRVRTDDRRMHRPVHEPRKRHALFIRKLEDDDFVVRQLSRDIPVPVEAGDDLASDLGCGRARVAPAFLEAGADRLEEPVVVVLVELVGPPALVVGSDRGVVMRGTQQHQIAVDPIAGGQKRLHLLCHALLEFEDIGAQHEELARPVLEVEGIGEDIVVDSCCRLETVGQVPVADQIDISLGRDVTPGASYLHAHPPSLMRSVPRSTACLSWEAASRAKPEFIAS